MEFCISQKDWKKVIDYAQASYDEFSSEIGGFMIAKPDKDGNIIISEPEILKQEVTGGTTVMDKEAVADYYVKCVEKHGVGVRFIWWHSHANMSAFWSGTDTTTMEEYSSGDWAAFLVVNIRGEYKFRVCLWNPIKAHEDIELNIINGKPKRIPKAIKDSVSELCTKSTTSLTKFNGSSFVNRINRNIRQTSLYDDHEWTGWQKSFSNDEDPLLTKTVEMIEEWCDAYIEGTFGFKEWLKLTKTWNKMLKGMDKTFDIKELTENELLQNSGIYAGFDARDLVNLGELNGQNIKV